MSTDITPKKHGNRQSARKREANSVPTAAMRVELKWVRDRHVRACGCGIESCRCTDEGRKGTKEDGRHPARGRVGVDALRPGLPLAKEARREGHHLQRFIDLLAVGGQRFLRAEAQGERTEGEDGDQDHDAGDLEPRVAPAMLDGRRPRHGTPHLLPGPLDRRLLLLIGGDVHDLLLGAWRGGGLRRLRRLLLRCHLSVVGLIALRLDKVRLMSSEKVGLWLSGAAHNNSSVNYVLRPHVFGITYYSLRRR